jgi:GNAT superfamily N-acetyltransferase
MPIEPAAQARVEPATRAWRVRGARRDDVTAIVAGVSELLVEVGGTPPPALAMEAAARALLEDGEAGTLLVAEADDGMFVGVLAASWQAAIHIPGRYALIQELWVHPSWRSRAVGAGLLTALAETAGELGVERVEVGLPKSSFAQIRATEAFYAANGFQPLGRRMRRSLP